MGHHTRSAAALAAVAATVLLSACGGGGGGGSSPPPPPPPPTTFTVGGTVSGLAGGGLVLRNNGGNDLALAANGPFVFTAALASGGNYSVSVHTQPTTQTCTVGSGSGVVAANVANVAVACVNTYSVGGTIGGLAGAGLVLRNGSDSQTVAAGAASFTFATRLLSGSAYSVVVNTNPVGPLQTCVASNASGNVASSDVTNVAIACTTLKFAVGGTVSGLQGGGLVLRNNGGDSLPINANGAFTFATHVDSGGTYDVRAFTHPLNPDQECSATRGSGTVIDAVIANVAIDCYVMGKFLFATNSIAGTLTGATINQATGVLDAITGVPVTSGDSANGPTVTPNGRFLYVTNRDDATISGFSVNATSGVMTPVPNSPVAAGQIPIEPPTVDPTGKFLYATDQTGPRLFGYRIDADDGELTPAPGSPYGAADRTIYVRVDPTGRFAYVVTRSLEPATTDAIALTTYSIDSTTGALTLVAAPLAVGTSMPLPGAMQLTADGAALFILPFPSPGQIYGYTLNATTGLPTAMAGSPFQVPLGASHVRPHPRLPVLYVGAFNSIAAYSVGAGLTPLAGSPYALTGSTSGIVFDPGTRFLYAAGFSSGITIFEVKSDGALEPMINGFFATPFAPSTLVADPGGRYLFISDFTSGSIQPIAIDTRTGRLSLVQGNSFNGGNGTNYLAIAK